MSEGGLQRPRIKGRRRCEPGDVDESELDVLVGSESGLEVGEGESEDRVRLGSCDGGLDTVGGGPVASRDELE